MSKTHINGTAVNLWSALLDSFLEGGCTGNIWFVNSVSGTDASPPAQGRSPDAPFATVSFALSQATASNDDIIYVMPMHTENITSAAYLNMNKAGVRIKGLGLGRNRPQFTWTTNTAASWDVNSANCSVENCVFLGTGIASLVTMFNIKAADFTMQDCEFEFANSSNQATQAILTTAAANRMRLSRNHFHGSNNAGSTAAISIVGGTDARIEDCIIQGAFTTTVGGIQVITTVAVNLLIQRNTIQNLTAASTKAITIFSTSTGQIGPLNAMQILSGGAPVTGTNMSWVGPNYYANALATGSTLL